MNDATTTPTRPTADELNAHLAADGFVQVTTCTRSTLYKPGTVTFFEKNGDLYLRNARRSECLSFGERLLVSIRKGV